MNKDFETKLLQEFPTFFTDVEKKKNSIPYGLEIDTGWFDIIYRLCERIKASSPPDNFRFVQIKEKFGGLRIYNYNTNIEIEKLIDEAEAEAYKTCEMCGCKDDSISTLGIWIKTLCNSCREIKK